MKVDANDRVKFACVSREVFSIIVDGQCSNEYWVVLKKLVIFIPWMSLLFTVLLIMMIFIGVFFLVMMIFIIVFFLVMMIFIIVCFLVMMFLASMLLAPMSMPVMGMTRGLAFKFYVSVARKTAVHTIAKLQVGMRVRFTKTLIEPI